MVAMNLINVHNAIKPLGGRVLITVHDSIGFQLPKGTTGVKALLDKAIIEATARRLDMPMERVIVTVDRHGNTSSGSVPLALDAAVRSGKVQRGQLLLLEAFGGGFTWGSVLLRY